MADLEYGLPERVVITYLEQNGSLMVKDITRLTGLNNTESKISIGKLASKGIISVKEGKITLKNNFKDVFMNIFDRLDKLEQNSYCFDDFKKKVVEAMDKYTSEAL